MTILAILGSRDHAGRTAQATQALLQGAADSGASVEQVFLLENKIERCRQCDEQGWGTCRSQGQCVIEDDFASLADRLRSAEAVVFATPVYFSDLSESMKAYLDRLRRITRHETGQKGIQDKPAIGICLAGGGGGGAPACAVTLERTLQTCGFDVLDLVPVRRQNLDMKRDVLAVTGKWLARELHPA